MSGRRGRQGRERGACRGVLVQARVGFDRKIAGVSSRENLRAGFRNVFLG